MNLDEAESHGAEKRVSVGLSVGKSRQRPDHAVDRWWHFLGTLGIREGQLVGGGPGGRWRFHDLVRTDGRRGGLVRRYRRRPSPAGEISSIHSVAKFSPMSPCHRL